MITIDNSTETKNLKKLNSRGDISIQLFNQSIDLNKKYPGNDSYEDMLRFEWIKRNPLGSFSYTEFKNTANELINLTKEYQKIIPRTEVLFLDKCFKKPAKRLGNYDGFSALMSTDEFGDYVNSCRKKVPFEELTEELYRRIIRPEFFIHNSEEDGKHFMVCLSTSVNKRKLEFYGQVLNPSMFTKLVDKYHKPGLTHSLNHPFTDNFKGWIRTLT